MAASRSKTMSAGSYVIQEPNYAFALGELTGQVKALVAEVTKSNTNDEALSQRVAKLERKGYVEQGVLLAMSVAGSTIVQWLIFAANSPFAKGAT